MILNKFTVVGRIATVSDFLMFCVYCIEIDYCCKIQRMRSENKPRISKKQKYRMSQKCRTQESLLVNIFFTINCCEIRIFVKTGRVLKKLLKSKNFSQIQ